MDVHRTDEQIRQEILGGMRCVPGIEPGDVDIAVHGGAVTLTGHVPHRAALQSAEQLARRAPGARSITNQLQIHRPLDAPYPDASLLRAVSDAFGRGNGNAN